MKSLKKKSSNSSLDMFGVNFDADKADENPILNEPKRIRGFEEFVQGRTKTYVIQFNLGKGFWRGWTLLNMAKDENGVRTLQWILDQDFPEEIKECILSHLRKLYGND